MKLLILLVIVLAIIAIVQLTKVYELSRSLRKSREEDISDADNSLNANLMMVWMFIFFAATLFLYVRYYDYLPAPASAHGVKVDWLMSVNLWGITIAFFIVNFALFYVAWKFKYDKARKAAYTLHDNRLEMIWTIIPGISMAAIIIFGLMTWNDITGPAGADAIQIEVYSEQFKWTARYPGDDKEFGVANYNLIDAEASNPLGIVTKEFIADKLVALDEQIESNKAAIAAARQEGTFSSSYMEAMEEKVYRLQRHKQRILELDEHTTTDGKSEWMVGADDKIVKEIHLPLGREVEFIFRSQDVIHSAYMPHFRAQMNTVPGQPTRFKMTPTITTAEMRKMENNPDFNYILLCNKVCGAAHFNMMINIVVESEEEYNKWLKEQKTFIAKEEKKNEASAPKDTTMVAIAAPMAGNQPR
jgi:cytochrome c oxidase subunit II